jgi:antitoxin MazE
MEDVMVTEARLVQIGNSKGIRLPKSLISKYGLGDKVFLEELPEGILVHPTETSKLSWEDTYKAMAESKEDWSDWIELQDEAEL